MGEWLKPVREKVMSILRVDKAVFSHKLGQILTTFVLVDISWVFFRAESFRQGLSILKKMLGGGTGYWFTWGDNLKAMGLSLATRNLLIVSLLVLFVADLCKYNKIHLISWVTKQGVWLRWLIYYAAIFGVLIFGVYGPGYDASAFIYFQF